MAAGGPADEVGLAVPVDKVAESVDLEVLSRSMVPCCAGPISCGIGPYNDIDDDDGARVS